MALKLPCIDLSKNGQKDYYDLSVDFAIELLHALAPSLLLRCNDLKLIASATPREGAGGGTGGTPLSF